MMATTPSSAVAVKDHLRKEYVGKTLLEVDTPSAVLDLSKVRRNCARMLEAVDTLQFGWRVHIKTHKLNSPSSKWEMTQDQLTFIVSTIKEAENITPFLLEMKQRGRAVNILYGLPVLPSNASRLAAVAKQLGHGGLSLLVDHPYQFPAIYKIKKESGILPHLYIKIDMGTNRAGVLPHSQAASQLISDVLKAEGIGAAVFLGLYSHAGHSYYGNDRASAIDLLRQEFEALLVVAELVKFRKPSKKLVLSVGDTPTTTSIRNLLVQSSTMTAGEQTAISALKGTIEAIKTKECEVELHAGVYAVLDLQQLATHALSTDGPNPMLGWQDLALTVIAEVASVYPGRGKAGRPEALVTAGSLALGREPCKAYSGWGIVSPWNIPNAQHPDAGPERHAGWQVGRISQEHGVLTWSGDEVKVTPLGIGQKIRIFPNHSCISGACYEYYLVVDSERKGSEDEIIDIWPRWRGW